ncbi:MAG: FkbM family methyltransferase [Hyphococcus sp.]
MTSSVLQEDKPLTSRSHERLRALMLRAAQSAIAIAYPWPRSKTLNNGLKVMIDPKRRWIDFNIVVRSQYEPGTQYLIGKLLQKKGVFIDVGANIGVISAFAARHVGAEGLVYAFEPDSINFTRLTWAREQNGLAQLLPVPLALGDRAMMAPLRRAASGDGGLSSLAEIEGFETHGAVPVMRLDDFIKTVPLDRIDVIKIDVEGFEKNVVSGARDCLTTFKPAVIMEMVAAEAVSAGRLLLECGYVAFIAGDKADPEIKTLRPAAPHRLIHNNMLFIHETKVSALPAAGFQLTA